MTPNALDAIDRRILVELQADARLTNVELAARVGLSASPCIRRLKRLERDGVIEGYRTTLDRAKLGLGLTIYVGIKVERHHDAEAVAFEEAVRALPSVVSCHLISGEVDFLLQIVVADLASYEQLLFGTLLKLPGVKDIRSSFAMRTVKAGGPLPLDHLPQ
jgi:Lrp/AsnC family leucine-responsive transcriptional regulator